MSAIATLLNGWPPAADLVAAVCAAGTVRLLPVGHPDMSAGGEPPLRMPVARGSAAALARALAEIVEPRGDELVIANIAGTEGLERLVQIHRCAARLEVISAKRVERRTYVAWSDIGHRHIGTAALTLDEGRRQILVDQSGAYWAYAPTRLRPAVLARLESPEAAIALIEADDPIWMMPGTPAWEVIDTAKALARAAEASLGLPEGSVADKNKAPMVVLGRRLVWRALRRAGWTVTRIGRAFGYDHTSISSGVSMVEAALAGGRAKEGLCLIDQLDRLLVPADLTVAREAAHA